MRVPAKALRQNKCRLSLRERTFFRGAKGDYGHLLRKSYTISIPGMQMNFGRPFDV
jgi:hypothetical protein